MKLDLRDRFVGTPQEAYRHHLHLIAYNTRHLLVPWLEVPHLASHLIERIAAVFRLSASVVATLERSTQSNKRLLTMLFGPKSESGRNVGGGMPRERTGRRGWRRGHGRSSQKRYTGAPRIPVAHPCLRPGQSW